MSNDTELLHASVIKRIWKKCKEEDMDIVAFAWRIQREAERATQHTEAVRMSEAEMVGKALFVGGLFDDLAVNYQAGDIIAYGRAVEQATAERLGVTLGDV